MVPGHSAGATFRCGGGKAHPHLPCDRDRSSKLPCLAARGGSVPERVVRIVERQSLAHADRGFWPLRLRLRCLDPHRPHGSRVAPPPPHGEVRGKAEPRTVGSARSTRPRAKSRSHSGVALMAFSPEIPPPEGFCRCAAGSKSSRMAGQPAMRSISAPQPESFSSRRSKPRSRW